jgi:hypothetical protein
MGVQERACKKGSRPDPKNFINYAKPQYSSGQIKKNLPYETTKIKGNIFCLLPDCHSRSDIGRDGNSSDRKMLNTE